MTSTFKLYGGIALLIILGLMVWGVVSWDNNRLQASFDEGVMQERSQWVAKAAEAAAKQAAEANQKTLISEAAADQAQAKAGVTIAASTAQSHSIVEKINHAYDAAPPVVCSPDAAQPLPSGVLEGLREARSAALGQAPTAPGGLQPTERSRSPATSRSR